jgi:hypothetical protein
MNDLPRQKLHELIIEYGRSLCDDPRRCEAFSRDYCGQYKREIFLLVSALQQGIAKELIASNNIPIELTLGRLIKRMQEDSGFTEEAARYAVEGWARALGKLPSEAIDPTPPPPTSDLSTPSTSAYSRAPTPLTSARSLFCYAFRPSYKNY